ncbi:COX15/CtaA family protein [Pelobium manganitolerans]|uniref:COX15/CtaA family protein n=1 Tax=Pelobium manganitolerans TaxID=1842495 RepID=UPI003FA3B8B1
MKNLTPDKKNRAVAIWLMVGVFMIIVQIIIGGVTRLTGSGLSITEWAPIMGVLPPLNHDAWLAAFDQYKQYGQFKHLNSDFTLSDFKFIFFWEWFHRLWARSLGFVFIIPFFYFLINKYFSKKMVWPLVLLFILGGLQGLIGWIMVQSGLTNTSISVNHIKLAIHFIAALVLLVYTFWFALKLLVPQNQSYQNPKLKAFLTIILALLTVQLIYGGFMAGLKAARFAPTWPSINGEAIPTNLWAQNWVDHPINVHFVHRGLAYLLTLLIVWGFFKIQTITRNSALTYLKQASRLPLILIFIQVSLGVASVLSSRTHTDGHFGVFETFAAFHQLVGILLLLSLVYQYYLVEAKQYV